MGVYDPAKRLGGDVPQVVLITLLYTLQGIPLGLVHGSLPYLLKKHLSYSDLAIFSLSSYPYLFKLFWSPIVDSRFIPALGRRKSWIVPCQVLMGLTLLLYSPTIESALATPSSLFPLTATMFFLILLAATQDIAVDAWALELLLPENRALGSVCQSVGQYLGFFISFPVMIAVNSTEFSVQYLHTTGPALPISGFFRLFGLIFIVISVYIQLCVRESPSKLENESNFTEIIVQMSRIVRFSHMKNLILTLLTVRIGLAAFDSVFMLQLTDHGFDEMEIGALSMCLIPVEIVITVGIGWVLAQKFSLAGYRLGFIVRIGANIGNLGLLWAMPRENVTWGWYFAVVGGCLVSAVGANMMFSVITSLFFRISQQSMGGTYMTFLATVLNFGAQFPNTLALWGVDLMSSKGVCVSTGEVCNKGCGECEGTVNGFYPLAAVSLVVSVAYFVGFLGRKTREFEALSVEDWHYVDKNK